jgi:hypothetical protein
MIKQGDWLAKCLLIKTSGCESHGLVELCHGSVFIRICAVITASVCKPRGVLDIIQRHQTSRLRGSNCNNLTWFRRILNRACNETFRQDCGVQLVASFLHLWVLSPSDWPGSCMVFPYYTHPSKSISGVRESNSTYITPVNSKSSCDKCNMGCRGFDERTKHWSCRSDPIRLWDRYYFALDMHKYGPRDGGWCSQGELLPTNLRTTVNTALTGCKNTGNTKYTRAAWWWAPWFSLETFFVLLMFNARSFSRNRTLDTGRLSIYVWDWSGEVHPFFSGVFLPFLYWRCR